MVCTRCGKEISPEGSFCMHCGSPIKQDASATVNSQYDSKKTNASGRKKLVYILCAVAVVVVVACMIISSVPSLDLKYEWGTSYEYVVERETVIFDDKIPALSEITLCCEDAYNESDNIYEFPRKSNHVFYWFSSDLDLYRIHYYLAKTELTLTEKLDILKSYYGDDVYIVKNGTDARFHRYYWNIDDTIIEFYNDDLEYLSIEYCRESISYDSIAEHFDR